MRHFGKTSGTVVLALGITAIVTACSKEEGPEAFVNAGIKAIGGEPQAIWNALPPSYQKDVQGLIAAFGAQMNPQVYDEGMRLVGKAVKVLETKKEFVLNHPQVKQMVPAEETAKGWDPAVRSVSVLVNSDLKTVEGLKKLDVEKFMAGPIAQILEDVLKAADVAASAMPMKKGAPKVGELREKLHATKVTVKSVDGDKATIEIAMPGEEVETQQMVKVEGKWIPAELAAAWPMAMQQARAQLAQVKIDPAMVVQFNAMKGMVEPVLDGLLAAKTQDEFNGQIDNVMKAFMGGGRGGAPRELAQVDAQGAEPQAELAADKAPVTNKVAKTGKKGAKKKRSGRR